MQEYERSLGNTGLQRFARKTAASDNLEYSVDEAEKKDLIYIIENSCMSCNKLLGGGETKVLPTKYVQDRDEFVRNGIVNRRYLCVRCYRT